MIILDHGHLERIEAGTTTTTDHHGGGQLAAAAHQNAENPGPVWSGVFVPLASSRGLLQPVSERLPNIRSER